MPVPAFLRFPATRPPLRRGLALSAVLLATACNPFAPALDDEITDPNQLLGNPVTVRGFFDRFRASYQLRDSTLYGQLLNRQFTFTYRDFAANADRSWNRDVDVTATYKLFRAARAANLQWTNFLPTSDTAFSDTLVYVERAFSLSIEQRDNTRYDGAGTARLVLVRKHPTDPWRMRSWYDRSEFEEAHPGIWGLTYCRAVIFFRGIGLLRLAIVRMEVEPGSGSWGRW